MLVDTLPLSPSSKTFGTLKNDIPSTSKSYCLPVDWLEAVECAMIFTTWLFDITQECSSAPDRMTDVWISWLSAMILRFPDVIDHTTVISCSTPRHAVPVSPLSTASILGKPKRLRVEEKYISITNVVLKQNKFQPRTRICGRWLSFPKLTSVCGALTWRWFSPQPQHWIRSDKKGKDVHRVAPWLDEMCFDICYDRYYYDSTMDSRISIRRHPYKVPRRCRTIDDFNSIIVLLDDPSIIWKSTYHTYDWFQKSLSNLK